MGSRIREQLDQSGWETHALVRLPKPDDRAVPWRLGQAPPVELLQRADALVHCAYDFAPRRRDDIWRLNVGGSAVLFDAAAHAGVRRVLTLSSMSAYPGTCQIYGEAKLAIEDATLRVGGIAVRAGLVYGSDAGGMVGALLRLARLPALPLIGARSLQYPVYDEDLAKAVVAILEAPEWLPEVFGIAQPDSMTFREVLTTLMQHRGLRCLLVPIPWRPVYWGLRLGEAVGLPSAFRADSILGLVRPAPYVPLSRAVPDLLLQLRTLSSPPPDTPDAGTPQTTCWPEP